MSTTEKTFGSGPKHSSSVYDRIDVALLMKYSFYLPVDILKHPEWTVYPIDVLTGDEFQDIYSENLNLHCIESYDLCTNAKHVAVSKRIHKASGISYDVAKVWYGEVK